METNKPRFGPEQFPAGSIIIHQGDLPEKFYIIASGYADVEYKAGENSHIIDRLGPGDFFGEIGLLKQQRRNATVRARSDVSVMSMDQQIFRNWVNNSGLVQEEMKEMMDIREKRVERHVDYSDEEFKGTRVFRQSPRGTTADSTSTPEPDDHPTDQGPLQFSAGEVLVRQGAPANRFYIIIEGELEVVQQINGDQELVIGRLNDGEYFGEIGLLEGSERTATIRAVSEAKVLPFTRDQFRSWLAKSPDSKDEIEKTAHNRLLRDTDSLRPLD